ncbi:hypothetical protein DEO72_LG5g2592 [Vigna unguiculata]|uniref:Uncharacterized protein n=1 Tax=Vigna unguiculata TaxID=3917 RepID=A0A4D6M1N0_VIGUN|nr:hypothetical protein DEO72_LG5g2592 [Vigna unguiculata]
MRFLLPTPAKPPPSSIPASGGLKPRQRGQREPPRVSRWPFLSRRKLAAGGACIYSLRCDVGTLGCRVLPPPPETPGTTPLELALLTAASQS